MRMQHCFCHRPHHIFCAAAASSALCSSVSARQFQRGHGAQQLAGQYCRTRTYYSAGRRYSALQGAASSRPHYRNRQRCEAAPTLSLSGGHVTARCNEVHRAVTRPSDKFFPPKAATTWSRVPIRILNIDLTAPCNELFCNHRRIALSRCVG